MRFVSIFLLFSLLPIFSSKVYGDRLDTTLLNGKGSPQEPSQAGLQSGRYQIKKDDTETVIFPKKQKKPFKAAVKKYRKHPASENLALPVKKVEPQKPAEVEEPEIKEPTLTEQVSDILTGGHNQTANIYREQVHPDDVRVNKIEVDVSSGFIYDSSIANLSYRNYFSMAPDLSVGGRVWITPLVGLSGRYTSTFGEDVAATNSSTNRVAVKSEWTEIAIDFRKFYGMSRRANSLQYGFIYSEYKFGLSTSETTRVQLKSSGVSLYLSSRIPVAPSYAWVIGGDVAPIISHNELATGLNLQSGTSVASSRVGAFVGGEIKFSRQNQVTWTLGLKMERNQFSGNSNQADPYTGSTPNGVSVTNTWSYFQLGYRWGQ
jgi:hypothetical protein